MSSLNIIKKYPELLELAYLSEREREHDLHAIFKRDIEDNCQFSFRGWRIYPIKTDGEIDMARLFKHLTCEEIMVENEDGTTYPKRVFEMARSQRLHWINHHVRELTPDNLDVFTIEERDGKKRKVKKTYIYDKVEKYVIVQLLHVYRCHIRSSLLAECDWIDAEIRVLCLILVFIDEVNHLLFASSVL